MKMRRLVLLGFVMMSYLIQAQCVKDSEQPVFIGGEQARLDFLFKNVVYPPKARDNCISGLIIVKFIVDTTGNLDSIQIHKGVHPFLNNEALRVAKLSSGKWIPACKNGKPVRELMILPVKFTIQGGGPCAGKDYFYNLGVSNYNAGNLDMALSYFKKAIKENPYDVDALYNLAVISLSRKDTVASCKYLKEIKEIGGTDCDELLNKICK